MIFSTKDIQVVLASSSKVRIEYLKKAKIVFGVKKHSVNEEKVKKKIKAPVELSKELAMLNNNYYDLIWLYKKLTCLLNLIIVFSASTNVLYNVSSISLLKYIVEGVDL